MNSIKYPQEFARTTKCPRPYQEADVSLALLNLGASFAWTEIPAYEANLQAAWTILPISAVTELTAVALSALKIGITLLLPPP
jgi:hypothetical protein